MHCLDTGDTFVQRLDTGDAFVQHVDLAHAQLEVVDLAETMADLVEIVDSLLHRGDSLERLGVGPGCRCWRWQRCGLGSRRGGSLQLGSELGDLRLELGDLRRCDPAARRSRFCSASTLADSSSVAPSFDDAATGARLSRRPFGDLLLQLDDLVGHLVDLVALGRELRCRGIERAQPSLDDRPCLLALVEPGLHVDQLGAQRQEIGRIDADLLARLRRLRRPSAASAASADSLLRRLGGAKLGERCGLDHRQQLLQPVHRLVPGRGFTAGCWTMIDFGFLLNRPIYGSHFWGL